jgi:hypothetical protein
MPPPPLTPAELAMIRERQAGFDEDRHEAFAAVFEAEIRRVADREGEPTEQVLRLTLAEVFDHDHAHSVPLDEAACRTGLDVRTVSATREAALRAAADSAGRRVFGPGPRRPAAPASFFAG